MARSREGGGWREEEGGSSGGVEVTVDMFVFVYVCNDGDN